MKNDKIDMALKTPPQTGGELSMLDYILLNVVTPIFVGIVLKLFSNWLDKKDDD